MTPVLRQGLARLRRDRARAVLTIGGIAAAAAMVGAAATLVLSLAGGFDRTAARANLPDVTASFAEQPRGLVAARVRTLPNIRRATYRFEANAVGVQSGENFANADVDGVLTGPRGYAVVEGRDVARPGEIVVERGLARSWHLRLGDVVTLSGPAATVSEKLVGVAVAPDSVAYPLVRTARVYTAIDDARRLVGAGRDVDVALLWLSDRAELPVTLAQARAASYGLSGLRFVTRSGFQALIGRAAGVVIALLVAFSLVALGAAGVMLVASSAAEVQRRREAIGVLRALGATPTEIANGYALETVAVAAPTAAVGVVCGWLAVAGPTSRLLGVLNELPPNGGSEALVLAGCSAAAVLLIAAATWFPAWRAAGRPPVECLRGADVVPTPRRLPLPALAGFGARLTLARPVRAAAIVAVLSASAAVILLILTIATVLHGLERNAQTLGTRYQLTVPASETTPARVRAVRGVAAAAVRYEVDAADSFDLGESFRLIAFPGDVSSYEDPPLAAGRRVRRTDEADVGLGLSQALDLHVGGTLAAQLPSGAEVRFHVVGIVEALRNEGLIAYVQPKRLLSSMPGLSGDIAVKLRPTADVDLVRNILLSRGVYSQRTGGIASDAGTGTFGRTSFLHVLAALLRSVAFLDGLVCLYALAQMLALIARERRRAVAIVRAVGASRAQVLAVFAGSALLIGAIAAPVGIVLERFVLGPTVSNLAVSYVTLPLRAGAQPVALVLAGLAFAVVASAGWATRAATSEPIVGALREE
jgi:ABC-type lipoprotein release transport system permease subunit